MPALVRDEQAADPLPDAEPDPVLQAERRGDFHGDRSSSRASILRRSSPATSSRCVARHRLWPAAVTPAHDLEPPVAPDRQPRATVAIQEADLPLAPALVDAPLQPVPPDQFRGQLTPCQGDSMHWKRNISITFRNTIFPAHITDVVFIGGVAVNGGQGERGGAAEDEPAVASVDLALEPGDGLARLRSAGGSNRSKAGNRPWGSGSRRSSASRVAASRGIHACRRHGRAASSRTSNRSLGTASVDLAEPAWPFLYATQTVSRPAATAWNSSSSISRSRLRTSQA